MADIPDMTYRFYGTDIEFLGLAEAVGGNIKIIKNFFAP